MMVQTGHRADFRVLKNWADHCGEAFDWYAGAYDGLLWQTPEGEKYDADKDAFVVNRNLYKPYDPDVDHERVFTGTLSFSTPNKGGHKPIMLANFEKAQATGNVDAMVTGIAATMDDGTVKAVITYEDEAGNQTREEKNITIFVSDIPVDDGMMMDPMPMEEEKTGPGMGVVIAIALGIVVVAAAAVVAMLRIRKKKKAAKQLAEDLMDLDKDETL